MASIANIDNIDNTDVVDIAEIVNSAVEQIQLRRAWSVPRVQCGARARRRLAGTAWPGTSTIPGRRAGMREKDRGVGTKRNHRSHLVK